MGKILVASLGWSEDELTLGAIRRLREDRRIFLKTIRCGASAWLDAQGISYASFDKLYDSSEDFDELTERIVSVLVEASEAGDVFYGVNDPGDVTCVELLAAAPDRVELIGGVGEGSALSAFAGGSFLQVSAIEAGSFLPDASRTTLVREIDSAILAGEVKLKLMEAYPEEWEIIVSRPDGSLVRLPLCELDRLEAYDHRVCALIPAVKEMTQKERFSFDDLNRIMCRLRAFDGCPWDREQTHASLRSTLIEEACEAVDAINTDDMDALCDELGDVLLQVAFHAEIGREYGEFDISDVTTAICRKMIARHPHVFGGLHCETAEDTVAIWEQIKMRERALDSKAAVLLGVTRSLPALMRAAKIMRKADGFGFPVDEDLHGAGFPAGFADEAEAGEFLLAAARHVARAGMEPELVLSGAADRLAERAARFEQALREEGRPFDSLSREELILRWKSAKENKTFQNGK